jgi:hypothetical protein
MDVRELPLGQHLARTRWGTHASGMAFDRKKTSYLTEQAQAFIAERSFFRRLRRRSCPGHSPGGTILLPDFVGNRAFEAIGIILETGQAALVAPDYAAQLALCFCRTSSCLSCLVSGGMPRCMA